MSDRSIFCEECTLPLELSEMHGSGTVSLIGAPVAPKRSQYRHQGLNPYSAQYENRPHTGCKESIMLFQQQTSINHEYAREHQVKDAYQVQCIQCGELLPFKIVTATTGLTSFFCEPTCDCGSTKEVNHGEI